jgi:hypothetical protein
MIRAGAHEETEDKICRFYGGLQTKIQDIADYKEYNTINHLFQLAMLAEMELQGRQLTRAKSSFTPRHSTTTPSTSCAPATARFSMTPSTSRAPHRRQHHQHLVQQQNCLFCQPHPPVAPPILSATVVMEKSYVATDDGGYVSASDVEDDSALQTNNAGDFDDDDAEVFGSEHTE